MEFMSEMMEREENETTVEFLALIAARRHARAGRHNSLVGGMCKVTKAYKVTHQVRTEHLLTLQVAFCYECTCNSELNISKSLIQI